MVAATCPALAAELDLRRGFYVDTAAPCAGASNATLYLLGRDKLVAGGREVCEFAAIKPVGPGRFLVSEVCDSGPVSPVEWVLEGNDTFTRAFDSGEGHTARYCRQSDLPAPWRNNDIRDLIR